MGPWNQTQNNNAIPFVTQHTDEQKAKKKRITTTTMKQE